MADEEKHHIVRTLKAEFDENNSKLRQVRPQGGMGHLLGDSDGLLGRPAARAPPNWALRLLAAATACGQALAAATAACAHQPTLPPCLKPQLEGQKRSVEAGLRRAAFTAAQLDELPEDARTYRSVGKA